MASLLAEAGRLATENLRESIKDEDDSFEDGKLSVSLTAQFALQFDGRIKTYRLLSAQGRNEGTQGISITGSVEGLTVFDRSSSPWESELPYEQLEVCLMIEPADTSEGQHYLVAPRHLIGYVAENVEPAEVSA
jgi:hypothetical protein